MDSIQQQKKYKENKLQNKLESKRELKLSKQRETQANTVEKMKNKAVKVGKGNITKKTKKKTKTRGQLVKELDAIFSRYIRMRDADNYGMCKCITCGTKVHWKNIQNGHFITRGNYKYRWSEINCRSQCMPCNIYKSGNYISYTLVMIGKYGQEKVKEMQEDKELIKISTVQIREMIEYYKKEVNKYEYMIMLEQDKYGV